jgi:Cof subfamily protein (haloacid dehalogenase superfamily)
MVQTCKAVFLDIDGTLIIRDRGPFKEDLEAIEEAAGKGHRFFLNSGRSFANLPPVLLDYPFFSGVSSGGGAHALFAETLSSGKRKELKTIYHQWVDEKLLHDICAFYLSCGKECILEGEKEIYVINDKNFLHVSKEKKIIHNPDDFSSVYTGDFITKLTMEGFTTEEEQNLLAPHFQINPFTYYSEGIIKGETKAKSMGILLEAAGVTCENSIALGDSLNDMDMIRFAGLGVAMGNACDELKKAAAEITLPCGEGGVSHLIRKYLL